MAACGYERNPNKDMVEEMRYDFLLALTKYKFSQQYYIVRNIADLY